ncbi:hypothetical protein IFR04_015020 [Cadophora malorum]|uniref:Uncharacterized protein n=1 Tax=Cadophora malorum TaxID=108018 RepID=A0A8H7VYX7_9HELO|nr:hypothetical protein IFR04_015020 [Cadophora malorum]
MANLEELKTLHVEDLMSQPRESVLELWRSLPAPQPGTFDGEWFGYVHVRLYTTAYLPTTATLQYFQRNKTGTRRIENGHLLTSTQHGDDPEFRADQMEISYNLAKHGKFWLGKSYKSDSGGIRGEGVNRYLASDGSYKRLHRYKWALSESKIDGKPAIVGSYRGFENVQGTEWEMCNEMRDLGDGRMLSATYANTTVKGVLPRMRADGMGSDIEFFTLTGPVAPWKRLRDPEMETRVTLDYN